MVGIILKIEIVIPLLELSTRKHVKWYPIMTKVRGLGDELLGCMGAGFLVQAVCFACE